MRLPDLECWFEQNPPPDEPIRISVCEVAMNPRFMVQTHIVILKANPQNPAYLPYYDRLMKLYLLTKKT